MNPNGPLQEVLHWHQIKMQLICGANGGDMDRRKFILGSTSALTGGLLLPGIAGSAAAQELPSGAIDSGILDTLPGKRPLIKRTFRPPNFETPIQLFRRASRPTMLSSCAATSPASRRWTRHWRLRVGGETAEGSASSRCAELRKGFEQVEVAAVNQCSGNRRGLFNPHVPGIQWGFGGMGNAVWSGVRLKDVLENAGVTASALEVVFDGADAAVLAGPRLRQEPARVEGARREHADRLRDERRAAAALERLPGAAGRPGLDGDLLGQELIASMPSTRPFEGFWMKTAYRVPKGMFRRPSAFESQDTERTRPSPSMVVNSLVTDRERAVLERRQRSKCWASPGTAARHPQVEVSPDGGRQWRPRALAGRSAASRGGTGVPFRPEAGAQTLMSRATNRAGADPGPAGAQPGRLSPQRDPDARHRVT